MATSSEGEALCQACVLPLSQPELQAQCFSLARICRFMARVSVPFNSHGLEPKPILEHPGCGEIWTACTRLSTFMCLAYGQCTFSVTDFRETKSGSNGYGRRLTGHFEQVDLCKIFSSATRAPFLLAYESVNLDEAFL